MRILCGHSLAFYSAPPHGNHCIHACIAKHATSYGHDDSLPTDTLRKDVEGGIHALSERLSRHIAHHGMVRWPHLALVEEARNDARLELESVCLVVVVEMSAHTRQLDAGRDGEGAGGRRVSLSRHQPSLRATHVSPMSM